MDLISPGLPKNLLHQARSTNTISFRLLEQIQQLHEKTNAFLATSGSTTPAENDGKSKNGESVADIFTEFYYTLQINANGKLTVVPEISIATLQNYQQRLSKVSANTDFDHGLVSIIGEYTTLVALHHLANSILYRTIVAKSHLAYWSKVRLSSRNKLIYGVQTLPEKVFYVLKCGFSNALDMVEQDPSKSRISRISGPVKASFKEMYNGFQHRFNKNFVLRQARFSFLRVPLKFLDEEIKHKINEINAELDHQYRVLGVFVDSLPVSQASLARVLPHAETGDKSVSEQLNIIKSFIQEEKKYSSTSPPGFFVRFWPLLLILINYGPKFSFNVWQNRAEIADWLKHNFFDTVVGFWRNWIVRPVGDMLSILRNDETMTITSKESLKSDLDSLERMVSDYLADTNVKVNPAEVSAAVKQGDLTLVMSPYEDELRTPYKSIIKGSLIRSILIQVQKTKVDGDLAISGIDKLLKSQQLLFGVLSISPSLFILYQANKALRKDASLTQSSIDRKIDCLKSMNQINRLVNREGQDDKFVSDGKLFVEVVNLNLLSHQIIPRSLRGEFLHDLNQLALASSENEAEIRMASARVWSMYSPFFRR